MRVIKLVSIFLLLAGRSQGQLNDCINMNKAIQAVSSNFATYTNFQFKTNGGQSAYLADFSFVANASSYIYKDDVKQDIYFYQKLDNDNSKFNAWYKSIEQCLVKDSHKWTKVDAAVGNAVIFTCDYTGGEVALISGSVGITVKINRDKKKSLPGLVDDFCPQLENMTIAADMNFESVLGSYRDSGIMGRRYESKFRFGPRNLPATIRIDKDIFNKNSLKYSYFELIYDYDATYNDLLSKFDGCLTSSKGWKRSEAIFGTGFQYVKGLVKVTMAQTAEWDNPHTSIMIEKSGVESKATATKKEFISFLGNNGKYGFQDENNNVVIPARYMIANEFHNGYSVVSNKDIRIGNGFIDSTGKEIWVPYHVMPYFSEGGLLFFESDDGSKVGAVNNKGKLVIPPIYKRFRISNNGSSIRRGLVSLLNQKGKWGYLDTNGKTVIPFIYDAADSFDNSDNPYAKVKLKGREFLIDTKGKEVLK
jgi:hypothetical protein